MKKEDYPKFFEFNIVDRIVTIMSAIALFGFWNKLTDLKKFLYIVLPSLILMMIINMTMFYFKTKKLYKKYEEQYKNNQALAENYKDNVRALKQEQYNNTVLRDFSQKIFQVLLFYDDLSKEEKKDFRKNLLSNLIDTMKMEDNTNEKEI